MENDPGDYLHVPITEQERVQARSRSTSVERLLSSSPDFDKEYTSDPPQSRFGSLRGQPSKGFPSLNPFTPTAGRYAPISPINEEYAGDTIGQALHRQRTIHQAAEAYQQLEPLPELWRPIWLRTWVLAFFAGIFSIFLVVVVVLWVVSKNNDGWHVSHPHKYEYYTYIPTILLVILVAGWRQVDYHTKALMPWDELQKGPISPQKSLLLDYISPLHLVSLFKAFLLGHVPISASASTFILLKIMTIFATALLILVPTDVSRKDLPLLATSKFDATGFDPSGDLTDVSSAPVYAFYGAMAGNLPFQPGVLADRAYTLISFDDNSKLTLPGNATMTAKVSSFVPDLECHPINTGLTQSARINQTSGENVFGDGSIGLILPDGDVCPHWNQINISALNPQTQITPSQQTTGIFQAVYCAESDGRIDPSRGAAAQLYTVVDIAYEQSLFANASDLAGGSTTISSSASRTVRNIQNVICRPSYSISNVTVSNDTTRDGSRADHVTFEPGSELKNETLPKLSNQNMTTIFAAAISRAENLFGRIDGDSVASASHTLFTLMAMTEGARNLSNLLDAQKLSSSASAVFKGVLAQYASQTLRSATADSVEGTVQYRETRLHINGASAIAMIIGLAVAAGCAVVLIFVAPGAVVPRDPNSIATLATILTRSTELNRLLRRDGIPGQKNQEAALEGYEFGTAIATTEAGQSSFKIVTSEGIRERVGSKLATADRLKWWHPITSSLPFAAIAIALPLIIIVLLESFQRTSDRNHGIHSVPDNQDTDIFTHYIPALVMVIVASLVNFIGFNVELFAPWSRLARGGATHRQSLLMHFLGKSPPFAFIEAIRTRRVNVILAIVATTIASILAVIVVGLYNTDSIVSVVDPVSLNKTDQFTLEWSDSFSNDNGAAGMLSLVMHQKLPFPDFTYGAFAFPKFSLGRDLDARNKSVLAQTGSATVAAYGADLNCYSVDQDGIRLTTATANDIASDSDQALLTIQAPLPQNCLRGGVFASADSFQYQVAISLPPNGQIGYGGRQIDLTFGENASYYGNGGESNGQYIGDNPPIGCPSLAFTFGEFVLGTNDTSRVTALVCYQQIQSLNTNVTLFTNTTTIDHSHPPAVLSDTVTLQKNPLGRSEDVTTFDFRIQENLARQFDPFPPQSNTDYDAFFAGALNNGTPSLTPQSLVGHSGRQTLYDALNLFYARYMAQAISLNMRHPIAPLTLKRQSSSSATIGDFRTTRSTPRLLQNRGAKTALQVLLALVSALTAGAWATSRFRNILPCNPCSIAGSMSLIAGSDLCHSLDDGLCECCGKPRRNSFGTLTETIHADHDDYNDESRDREQMIKDGAEWLVPSAFDLVFAGKRYSMGWWKERAHQGKRRRFGVDIGTRADGADDADWSLGKRRRQNTGFRGFMEENVGRGRGRGRDWRPVGRGWGPVGRDGSGNANGDGRGLYHTPDHRRAQSLDPDADDGDLGRMSRGRGDREQGYEMSGAVRGEA